MAAKRISANFCVALGEVIRAERKRLGWSQEELAEHSGLSRGYITELESGLRTPNLDTLVRISSALGMKTSKLIAAGEVRLPSPR